MWVVERTCHLHSRKWVLAVWRCLFYSVPSLQISITIPKIVTILVRSFASGAKLDTPILNFSNMVWSFIPFKSCRKSSKVNVLEVSNWDDSDCRCCLTLSLCRQLLPAFAYVWLDDKGPEFWTNRVLGLECFWAAFGHVTGLLGIRMFCCLVAILLALIVWKVAEPR